MLRRLDTKFGLSQRTARQLPVPHFVRVWLCCPFSSLYSLAVPALAVVGVVYLALDGFAAVKSKLSEAFTTARAALGV